MKKIKTISKMVAKFDTMVVEAMLSRLTSTKKQPIKFDLESTYKRIAKHCSPGRVNWCGIKDYNASTGNVLTKNQMLALHNRIFRN